MICRLSSKILTFVSKYVDITSEMNDIYQYGIEITISSILNIILVLLCSLFLSDFFAGLTYLFIFVFLRSFTGGYHATTYFRCNLTIVTTFLVTFIFYKTITYYEISFLVFEAIMLISLVPIIIFSPVPNKHKPLTDMRRKQSYKLSIVIASALSLIGLILFALGISIGAMIILTVAMISLLILAEIFMQRRGYHEG